MGREHQFDGSPGSLGADPYGLTGILEATAKAAAVDPALQSAEALMGAAVGFELARENLEAAHARVLARLETTGATDTAVGMRPAGWLAWEADTNLTRCRQRTNIAKRLSWFGEFTDALGEGRVRFSHAEVLASVANPRNRDGLRAAQGVLIEWAGQLHFSQWATMVRQLAHDLDADGSFDPNEHTSRNRLRLRDNGDDTTEITGLLTGTDAVTVTQGLDALADQLFHRYRTDHKADPDSEIPNRAQLLAEALTHAVRLALSRNVQSTSPPRVEATIIIEEDPEAHPSGAAGNPAGHGPVGEATDHDNADPTRGHTADPTSDGSNHTDGPGDGSGPPPRIRIRDLNGRPIPTGVAEALLLDADLRALLLDVNGNPLWLGRTVRLATPAQRTALAARDGGCIFPGCDMPPQWCDVHHQPDWEPNTDIGRTDIGRTDIDKMFLGCRHHHGVTHRKGWTCRENPERPQHWIWTTPTGHEIHSQRQHRNLQQKRPPP